MLKREDGRKRNVEAELTQTRSEVDQMGRWSR